MFQYEIKTDNTRLIQDYIYLLQRAPILIRTITNKLTDQYAGRIKAVLSKEPPPARQPIEWTSERQMIAVILYLKERARAQGRGPNDWCYIRTHEMVQGYKVVAVYSDSANLGSIEIENDVVALNAVGEPVNYRRFVKGERQQQFHRITGWTNEADDILPVQEEMADQAEELMVQAFEVIERGGAL